MPPRIFTLDEANSLLFKLEPLVHRLMVKGQELRDQRQVLAEFQTLASRNGGAFPGERLGQAKRESDRLTAEIHEGVQQIESWGCVVKDLEHGLVDFLAHRGEEQVFLCWRLGESEIRYWHGLQEGFAGRKPLWGEPLD